MTAARLAIAGVSIDCEDHVELAHFYATMLRGSLIWSTPSSAGVRCGHYVLATGMGSPSSRKFGFPEH